MASIQKRNGAYTIRVACGSTNEGKRITKTLTYKPAPGMSPAQIKKEVAKQAIIFEDKCKSYQSIQSTIKLRDFAEIWLTEYVDARLSKNTQKLYRWELKTILRALGNIPIGKIQPHHLYQFYNSLRDPDVRRVHLYKPNPALIQLIANTRGLKTRLMENQVSQTAIRHCTQGNLIKEEVATKIASYLQVPFKDLFTPDKKQTLSSTTIHEYHVLLSTMLTTAVYWQILQDNPCKRVKPPARDTKESRYLDEDEVKMLFNVLQEDSSCFSRMIKILLYTGMRRGELCGLEWRDVDFKSATIHVCHNLQYESGKGLYESQMKTRGSDRVIKVTEAVLDILRTQKEWQQLLQKELGDNWVSSDKVFTRETGASINPNSLTNKYSYFIKEHGLKATSIHSLRHTNATLMLLEGTPIRTVAGRLGHSNTSTTLNIYAHATKIADDEAAKRLDAALGKLQS